MTEDHVSALERLTKLKAEGAISDADFEVQKARLTGAAGLIPPPPLIRRLWVVTALTVSVVGFPIALAMTASGEVYRKVDSGYRPISKGARWTWAGFLAIWLIAVLAKAVFHPGDWGADAPVKPTQATAAKPATVVSKASAKCEQPALAKGTPYPAARTKLLAAGYLPSKAKPESGSYCADSDHAETCEKLPEIQDCSADGYCQMAFSGPNGTSAVVTTFGDGPDGADTTAETTKYSCGAK